MLYNMMSACLILVLAFGSSAQYAITDLIGDDKGMGAQPSVAPILDPASQVAPLANTVSSGAAAPSSESIPAAGNVANVMASLLGGAGGATSEQTGPSMGANDPLNAQALSQDSMATVTGLVEAFMHKVKLMPGEKRCLENNLGQLTGDLMGTIGDAATGIKALIAGKGTVQKNAAGGLISAGMDSAMKVTSLVGLSTQLIKNCVHGDALILMKKAADHLINGTYLQHRFLVNGIDIAHSLADSIIAFESHDFHRFGADIGIALRKILLSKATKATALPEGMPDEVIIQKATDGLMRGFFVSGSAIEITDTAYPDMDIVVNLHRCIAGNSEFFKELWMATWDLIAQLALNGQQHDLGKVFGDMMGSQHGGGQPKWAGEFMVAMMQFPMALSRCGVGEDIQLMFTEAIKSLKDLKVQFKFPHAQVQSPSAQAEEASNQMAKAVEAWTNWDFEGFGYELGELFRNLVMLSLPQKYSVDASGKLRRYSEQTHSKMTASGLSQSTSTTMMIIGGAVVSLLGAFALIALRAHRVLDDKQGLVSDVEDGSVDGPGE